MGNSHFSIGDEVQIKPGASAWMRAHNYWLNDWPGSIDGMVGTIMHDYTQYAGNDCHYEVAIEGVNRCGIHPQWLTANPATTEKDTHTERIICPACHKEQDATVEHTALWDILVHHCERCGHIITESEWDRVKQ